MSIVKYIHMLTLCIWVGGMVFFTFVGAPAIFKELPRDVAGVAVGGIFPKYWLMGYVCPLLLLGTLFYIARGNVGAFRVQIGILAVATALSFASGMVVGVKAHAIKVQMDAEQDAVKKEELHQEFRKMHGVSAVMNLTVILLMAGYVWYIPPVVTPSLGESVKGALGL